MIQLLTAFLLGLLMILDPCTLFTSIAAVGYIDKEIQNKRRVLHTGAMFVLGKMVTYVLLAIPFIMGAQTQSIKHWLSHWSEPLLAGFMLICGVVLLFTGKHHHEHDHGVKKWIQSIDNQSSGLWAFMLGIFFAIAFCPHRFIFFFSMIDISVSLPVSWSWLLPVVFGLATGLPIMIIAWLISYNAVSIEKLTERMHGIQKWVRYVSAALFIGFAIYLCVHIWGHGHEQDCHCGHEHTEHVCHDEHCHH